MIYFEYIPEDWLPYNCGVTYIITVKTISQEWQKQKEGKPTMTNRKNIPLNDWAGTFIHAYDENYNTIIQIVRAGSIDVYTEHTTPGRIDLSRLTGIKMHTHDPISLEELSEAENEPGVERIILLLEKDGYLLEYAKTPKGDVVCIYEDDRELELAEDTIRELG